MPLRDNAKGSSSIVEPGTNKLRSPISMSQCRMAYRGKSAFMPNLLAEPKAYLPVIHAHRWPSCRGIGLRLDIRSA